MSYLNNSYLFRLLLGVVLLAPVPLGSNRAWAWSLLAIVIGGLLLAWSVGVMRGTAVAHLPVAKIRVSILTFAAALLWAYLQTLGFFDPAWSHPMWAEAQAALGTQMSSAISADPEMTRTAILRVGIYAGVFFMSLEIGRDRELAKLAIRSVAIAGACYAGFGIFSYFIDRTHIFWIEKIAYTDDLTATFVNRNAYAAYAGMGVICCLALFLHTIREKGRRSPRRGFRLAETLASDALPYVAMAVVILSALLLAHSRGVFVALILSELTLIGAFVIAGKLKAPTGLGVALGTFGLGILILSINGDGLVKRFADTPNQIHDEIRTELFRLSGDAIAASPFLGFGFGAFLPSFRMFRDASLTTDRIFDYAHNVYLETVMDLGIPAAFLFFLSLGIIYWRLAYALVARRRDQLFPATALAIAVLIGVHGFVDFSAQMPAIAMTFAMLLGIGYAHTWRTSDLAAS